MGAITALYGECSFFLVIKVSFGLSSSDLILNLASRIAILRFFFFQFFFLRFHFLLPNLTLNFLRGVVKFFFLLLLFHLKFGLISTSALALDFYRSSIKLPFLLFSFLVPSPALALDPHRSRLLFLLLFILLLLLFSPCVFLNFQSSLIQLFVLLLLLFPDFSVSRLDFHCNTIRFGFLLGCLDSIGVTTKCALYTKGCAFHFRRNFKYVIIFFVERSCTIHTNTPPRNCWAGVSKRYPRVLFVG
mmetsp:Transcript_29944/g.47575  ORF Transcript_29944/g.47575 Transcript_29944/m.47575 type:complete len:245 (+) Transcript_29944:2-736(+)